MGEEIEPTIVKGTHPYDLLKLLYKNKNTWINSADIYGRDKIYPLSRNGTPSRLYKKGLIDKVVENHRARIKISENGIKVINKIDEITKKPKVITKKESKQEEPIDSIPESIPELLPKDLYSIKSTLTQPEEEILKELFFEKAFLSPKAKTTILLQQKINIQQSIINESLEKLVSKHLAIKTVKNSYYLTENGMKIAEAVLLKGLDFTGDSLAAFILNPIGRKVLHLIKEGITVNQIAEEIGYFVEDIFVDNVHRLKDEVEYAKLKVFQCLDRLGKFGLIKLHYHPALQGSTKITRVLSSYILEILKWVATIVEFLPTLLVEDDEHFSILRTVIKPEFFELKFGKFDEITVFPKKFRGAVAYAERMAHWIDSIEKVEAEALNWENIGLKINGNKHYFMLKKKD